jgi:hypothetical protein
MHPNHVCSLDILRTQSPNSCPDFLPDPPGIVIFSSETPLLCMVSCFLFIFRVHLGSFSDCVESQITESQGPQGPGHTWPSWWVSSLCNPVAVSWGLWTKRTWRSGQDKIIQDHRMSTQGTWYLGQHCPFVPRPIAENSHYSPILGSYMLCHGLKISAAPQNQWRGVGCVKCWRDRSLFPGLHISVS